MKNYLTILFAVLLVVLTACNKRDTEVKEITELSAAVDSMIRVTPVLTVEQKVKTESLIAEYLEFIKNYPNDSLCPQYLINSALLYHVMPDYNKELRTVDQLVADYPKSPLAPQGLAIAARVCEESLRDLNRAKSYLQQIQDSYADSPYAVNIDLQIEYIGDSEGLLEAIMERTGKKMPGSEMVDEASEAK